jgi:hypothetical protein
MINLGFDCHKVYSQVAMVDEQGKLIMETSVSNKALHQKVVYEYNHSNSFVNG